MQRILTITLIFLVFGLIGCSDDSSLMGPETDPGTLTFTIVNSATSGNTLDTIERNPRGPEAGDEVNIFIVDTNNNVVSDTTEFEVPQPGGTSEAAFAVPAGDYNVDLAIYEPVSGNPNGVDGSLVLGAATQSPVSVAPGEVTTVDFTTNGNGGDQFQRFEFAFDFEAGLTPPGQGEENEIEVQFNGSAGQGTESEADFIDFGTPMGQIGVDPDESNGGIDAFDPSTAEVTADFNENGNNTALSTFELPVNSFTGPNNNGEVSVMVQFDIASRFEGPQQELFLYTNVDGEPETNIALDGDGGIIIIFDE